MNRFSISLAFYCALAKCEFMFKYRFIYGNSRTVEFFERYVSKNIKFI